MENYKIRLCFCYQLVFLVMPTLANSQVEILLTSKTQTIGFLEPIAFEVQIVNKSNQTLELFRPAEGYDILTIQFRANDDKEWKSIKSSIGKLAGLQRRPTLVLKRRGVYKYSAELIAMDYINDKVSPMYLLNRPGKYYIRTHYFSRYNLKKKPIVITSNEVEIMVKDYQGIDKLAARFLLTKEVPHAIFNMNSNSIDIREVYVFIESFSQSSLANWARLYLLNRANLVAIREFNAFWLRDTKGPDYERELTQFMARKRSFIKEKLEQLIQIPSVDENVKAKARQLLAVVTNSAS